jgi:hypothetical protein
MHRLVLLNPVFSVTLIILLISGLLISCNSPVGQKQKAKTSAEEPGRFGEKIAGENAISGEQLMEMLKDKDSVWVTMTSKIISNCQKSGCWMDLDIGNGQVIKVTFKDYAFFIPLDSKGKTATVEGFARKEYVSVELRKHYAEDAGKSQEEIDAITEPETTFMFDAAGVIIKD